MHEPDAAWRTRFPDLFSETYVAYAGCRTSFTTAAAPDPLVSRLHVVAVTPGGHVVVCRSDQDHRFLPGGTREPGETLLALARRELLEEAGAELVGDLRHVGSHVADSDRPAPYRPHLPHPQAHWSWAVADVRLAGAPTNPDDGETVVEVLTLPPHEATDYLEVHDPVHAAIVRLAGAMGLLAA
ncbi:NUDIX hydrolase [Beutenbergia cavernae DSM 12333]|uniref:NUDIX hydrolase n=1 Tax=Beutenbergia cavernae (strain ATCC BAA-8 / DSM 12333 / CCUG 43141 / JCM 11478 / NBRC 16432 / NCIMB 13614 / HKI 0122) TaxID=471853 RepID=C5BY08_BEUC1|nr:NUDIX domain-containing protein [Beutenbergia cavernae]ACQ78902.1 NUDIX hydrolase [Beutenbergia cavernae DSM 12333]